MARLHTIIEDCKDQIRKAIYAIEPAAVDGDGQRWHAHDQKAGSILGAGESVRLFDILCAQTFESPITIGTTEHDYNVAMEVIVIYGISDEYTQLAISDYAAIVHTLHNIDVSAVTGLQCYIVGAATVSLQEDVRVMSVAFTARISAGAI